MTAWKRLLAIGAAVWLVGLLTMLPARVVHHWFSPPELQMSGISGTIWNGRASALQVQGLYLSNVRWSMQPLRLFTGKLAYLIQADPPGGFMTTRFAIGLNGRLHFNELQAALPIAALGAAIRNDDLGGDVTLQLDELELVDGLPTRALGQAGVANLLIKSLAPGPLGTFSVEFQNADNGITGIVEDVSGMLDVAATLQVNADRSYSLIGQVGTTQNAVPSIEQQLRFLGTANARGLREFRLEGAL